MRGKLINQFRNYCTQTKYPRKIFSGIQPTGNIHIGNYLGAIKQWVKLQDSGENVTLSIVDLHSITLPQEPKKLSKNILEMTATLLACGIDPNKTIIYQQSAVRQHTELCWIIGCISTMARLSHLPQFKEKSANLKDVPLGLYIYPVLQAADIMLYKATHIPVGEDQVQHLQLTQDLARMFNNRFGETFPMPHCMTLGEGVARIKSLRDPSKKMSKSDPDPKSYISLMDTPDDIRKKIKKAVTDFTSKITYEPETRLGVSNLISIQAEFTQKSIAQILDETKELDTLQYKLAMAEDIVAHIEPIRQKMIDYTSDPEYIVGVLNDGAEKARDTAEKTMVEVRRKVGFDVRKLAKASKKRQQAQTG